MNGKMTMSRSGSTGRTSGILGGSSSLRRPSAIALSAFHGNLDLAAPPVPQPGQGQGEHAVLEGRTRLLQVDGYVEGHGAGEAPLGPLDAQEATHAGRLPL